MRKSKIYAVLLAALMMFTIIAACTDDAATTPTAPTADAPVAEAPAAETPAATPAETPAVHPDAIPGSTAHLPDYPGDPITFTVFTAGSGQVPSSNNAVLQELARITGVSFEWEFTPGDIDQKVGVLIAGQEYADWIAPGQHRGEFLNAGAFLNLDGMIQHYPNLWKHYGPYEARMRGSTDDDSLRILCIWGRRYTIGDGQDGLYEGLYNGPAFWVQKDVLAWDNYAFPTNLPEFFDLLERYHAAHPDIDGQPTLPFEIFSTDWRSFSLKNPPQHFVGGRNEGDVVVWPGTFEVEIYQDKWYAEEYYKALNAAYHAGLIHPETFTRNFDQIESAIATGRVLAFHWQQWTFGSGEQVLIADERFERTYVPLGLAFEGNTPLHYGRVAPNGIFGNNGGGISINNENPDRFLEFLDYLLMPEVQILMQWGFVDQHFYVDDNGRFRRTPEQKQLHDDPDYRLDNLGWLINETFPKIEGRYPDGNAAGPGDQPEERVENMVPYDRNFYSQYRNLNGLEVFTTVSDFLPRVEPYPYREVWSLLSTMDAARPERETFDKITDIQMRYLPGVIMAADFEAAWAQYLTHYVPLADEIAALELWIHEGIMEEVNGGLFAPVNTGW
jgi:putative aldouronate transport system substrate-binding protein